MSVIALIEPHWWGHHPTYTKTVATILLEQGHDLLCACGEPDDLESHLRAHGRHDWLRRTSVSRLNFHEVHHNWRRYMLHAPTQRHGRWWSQAAHAISRMEHQTGKRVDIAFFVTLDPFILTPLSGECVDRLFPYPWTGLVLFPKWLHGSPGRPPKPLDATCFRGMFLLDETLTETATLLTGKPAWSLPDFTDTAAPLSEGTASRLQEIVRFRGDRPLIGLVGTTDRRKGIFDLLEIARLPGAADLRFLVCGDVSTSAQHREIALFEKHLRQARLPNFLHIRGRIRDEAVFNAILGELSLLWIAYTDFPFSSNLLTKAAYFRIPVAANVGGLIAKRVSEYAMGVVLPAQNPARSLAIIRRFLAGEIPWQPRFEEYSRTHSIERLREQLSRIPSILTPR